MVEPVAFSWLVGDVFEDDGMVLCIQDAVEKRRPSVTSGSYDAATWILQGRSVYRRSARRVARRRSGRSNFLP